jgi:hypothetical protein
MNDLDDRLARLNPVQLADVSDPASTTEARGLLQAVLSQPAGPAAGDQLSRRRRPLPAALAATAVATAAAVVGGLVLGVSYPQHQKQDKPAPNEQLVAFSVRHGKVIARITDPLAAASQLTAVFQAHGLHITVQAAPVSPSIVGTIVYTDTPVIRTLWKPGCRLFLLGCSVGLVIPASYTGHAMILVGRPARPGERYQYAASVFGIGEALRCSGLLGTPATAALPVLRKFGQRVIWWSDATVPRWVRVGPGRLLVNVGQHQERRPAGYIVGGAATSPHHVTLDTLPALPRTSQFREAVAGSNRGCHQ